MLNKTKKDHGFSLVEALVVAGVIAVLGLVLVQLLTRILKGGNKTQVISLIKQNGQVALNTIDTTVRQSDNVICPDKNTSGNILVILKNGSFTRIWFVTGNASDGYIAMDNPSVSDPTQANNPIIPNPNFLCNLTTVAPTIIQTLTAPGSVSLLTSPAPQFIRSSSSGSTDLLNIQFDLGPSKLLGATAENQVGTNNSVHFTDSVGLR